ncbi:unnamed protein product [Caenorhabditis angaria]|uniref:Uncharacterized protein n=1 Tax=Caenorhabditis angaria TaxID=860376 RepID=A0A9P1N8G6_9PELO|nr:unnamed protein product [Caenorhabditis angaria]
MRIIADQLHHITLRILLNMTCPINRMMRHKRSDAKSNRTPTLLAWMSSSRACEQKVQVKQRPRIIRLVKEQLHRNADLEDARILELELSKRRVSGYGHSETTTVICSSPSFFVFCYPASKVCLVVRGTENVEAIVKC